MATDTAAPAARPPLRVVVSDIARLLTFRSPSPAIATQWPAYLAFGLLFTWLAGIGRYWDNPRGAPWQHLGLGSLAYVLCLSLLLWLMLWPLRPQRWSWRNVLVFVTLTSPPALLYAIPVERFMALAHAQLANAWFLGLIASWRVALLVVFLLRVARLGWFALIVGTLLPLTVIVVALTLLNLEHVVFNIMAGIRPEERSPNDLAYMIVLGIAALSIYTLPILAIAFIVLALRAHFDRHRAAVTRDAP